MDMQHTVAISVGRSLVTNLPAKPIAITPNWDGIHAELKFLDQWVMWRYIFKKASPPKPGQPPKEDKWGKVPYQPSGETASSTNPATWSSFATCAATYERERTTGRFDGIGFVTSPSDDYVLIDLDHVIHPDGSMEAWAQGLLNTATAEDAYIETSVSGAGMHAIVRGSQGFLGTKVDDIEVYCKGRYFTITGHSQTTSNAIGAGSATITEAFRLAKTTLAERIAAEAEATARKLGRNSSSVSPPRSAATSLISANTLSVPDSEIVARARQATNGEKFAKLFDHGDLSGHQSDDSRADMALASLLAFWIGPDPTSIERIMRASALNRDKWDKHRTYLAITINKALAGLRKQDFYDWSKHGAVGTVTNPALQQILSAPSSTSCISGRGGVPRAALQTNRVGQILTVVNNVIILLESDPDLQGVIRYNEFADRLEIHKPVPDKTGSPDTQGYPRRWTDADSVALQAYIQRNSIPKISRATVEDALLHYAQDCRYHPVRDYLESLIWDQKARLDTWLYEYCNADSLTPAAYLEEVGSKFLISAVARVMRPGCKADHVLVLEGEQGIGKSTALSILAGPDWFTDSLPNDLADKDAAIHLKGRLIVEMSELSQFSRSQIETIKSYFTRQTDIFRPPFGRHDIEVPRQCVFAGSTNTDSYLIDTTGNRRFWPVKVGSIDTAALRLDRDQLWAEAHTRFLSGQVWHMTDPEVISMQVEQASNRVITDPWRDDVMSCLQRYGAKDITPGEVLNEIVDLKPSERHKGNAARVAVILRDLGWRMGKRHHKRGQVYLPPTDWAQLDLFTHKAQ